MGDKRVETGGSRVVAQPAFRDGPVPRQTIESVWIAEMRMCSFGKWPRQAAAGLLVLALAACATGPDAVPGMVTGAPAVSLNQEDYANEIESEYVLRAADTISVTVFREEQLSLEAVAISADGKISLPLLGSMNVAGKTPAAFENEVEQALGARYLQNPAVSVNVVKYGSHVVTVEGDVNTAGLYEFIPGTRLSGAIALAEGMDRTAKFDQVFVFRNGEEGREVARFDYDAVRSGTMLDPVLQPGDRVVVGTDGLTVAWQDFLKVVPLIGLFVRF